MRDFGGHKIQEQSSSRQFGPVTGWCGVNLERVFGLCFFEDDAENAITYNGYRYREILENFVGLAVEDTRNIVAANWGVTTYTA